MIHYKMSVREKLEALADYVEEHGEGALRGTGGSALNLAQVETYQRFYEGYKREVQVQSIESDLLDQDDPLYGWGWLAQHEPSVQVTGSLQIHDNIPLHGDYASEALKQKRNQTAELVVVRRPYIVATLPMKIIRATVSPIVIDAKLRTIIARIVRLRSQLKEPGIVEKLSRLNFQQTEEGLLVGVKVRSRFTVGPLE